MCKVSVIIPTYNRTVTLKMAIDSVLRQGVKDLNILIIDDSSDEECLAEIEQLALANDQIQIIRNENNLGVAASRNKGLEWAKGEFVLFLDDDDILLSDMLKLSLDAINENHLDLVSCRSQVVGNGLSFRKMQRYNLQQKGLLNVYELNSQPMEHLFLYTPQIHTFLVRRTAIGGTRFPENLNYGEDMMFWLTLVKKGLRCEKLNFVGSEYRLQKRSLTQEADHYSKMRFYEDLLSQMEGNKVIQNLCFIKMTYTSVLARKLIFIKWMVKAFSQPILLFKHIRFYF
ncbi:glycosyltransferase family 2 protein [Reichenbachiella sp.]|uniref:glycosyltransferase family 2 protein n=1 Tax=Reichenbachiella sp. TaxID=2184521 RepID=UPI003B59F80F